MIIKLKIEMRQNALQTPIKKMTCRRTVQKANCTTGIKETNELTKASTTTKTSTTSQKRTLNALQPLCLTREAQAIT